MSDARPNFLIVGAPKCGTTAMNAYLRQHPQVFIPERKEIHYFGGDLTFTCPRPTAAEYVDYFRSAGERPAVGEASVFYLLSRQAAAEIHAFDPAMRIVVMLRHPVEVLHALHSEHLASGNEEVEDFETALALESERRQGRRLPRYYFNLESLFYRDVVGFAEQIERFLACFDRRQVQIIWFDDFKADTAGAYGQLCQFLEIDSDHRPDFQIVNPNCRVRSRLWQRLVYQTSWASSFRVQRCLPEWLRSWLRNLNRVDVARAPLSPSLRASLVAELRPEVERLEKLLAVSLPTWKQ